MLPNISQIGSKKRLVSILCISIWVSCVRIANKLGGYPLCIGSTVFCYLTCKNIFPLELYSLCVKILWLSCVLCQVGSS